MRARLIRLPPPGLLTAALAVCAAMTLVACGLSLSGLGSPPLTSVADGAAADSPTAPDSGTETKDASPTSPEDASADANRADSPSPPSSDAGSDSSVAVACTPFDAGLNGALDLSTFTVRGNASWDENDDLRITLTNSDTSQAGAAWGPVLLPAGVLGVDLTWSFRVGPDDTAGDGIAFAVLGGTGAPGVGAGGDGVGLASITPALGGATPSGYAVDMDMYQNTNDATDIGPNTLKLVAMPAFDVVAETAVPPALNDGNTYSIDVAWTAPSTLTATLHGLNGQNFTATSSDPRLAAPPVPAYIGFTGATGAVSDSHNEISGITFVDVCK